MQRSESATAHAARGGGNMRGLKFRLSAAAGSLLLLFNFRGRPERDAACSKSVTARRSAPRHPPLPRQLRRQPLRPLRPVRPRRRLRRSENPAPARAGDPEAGAAGSQSHSESRLEESGTALLRPQLPLPSPRKRGRHRRHRQRHCLDVAARRQRHPHRQIPRRRGAGVRIRYRALRHNLRAEHASSRPCPARFLQDLQGNVFQRTCSIAASTPHPSMACRKGSRSTRTACASTRPSATSSTGTSCLTAPSTASPSSAPTRCSASMRSAAR